MNDRKNRWRLLNALKCVSGLANGHVLLVQIRDGYKREPESSALVVLAHYGIDAGSYSFPYVARWAKDKAVLQRNLAEVQGSRRG